MKYNLSAERKTKLQLKISVRLYVDDEKDIETMRRAVRIKALPEGWRDHFRRQIE